MLYKTDIFRSLSILTVFLFTFFSSHSQHFLRTEGKYILNESNDTILLRGMGLGGWMLQEGYMLQTAEFANAQHQIRDRIKQLIGEENTDIFYNAWLSNHVTKADIDSLKKWGFNSVRLPLHYNLFTLPIEEEPISGQDTWLVKGFTLTDSLLSWCKQNEMYVILDLHAAPGGQGQDMGISDYDPSKPSLWESAENRRKTVALWQQLAERYKDEEWIAGYDLLNETNWNLPGGTALANLYKEITDSIRVVDPAHIIFIEGNWFANDFTGLTPPWDDEIVYSPHKYWSFNDRGSIDWVLTLSDQYDVPLYFGECGENSNVWFKDAVSLFERNDIGWAWWPMKKVESISGPLSVTKTQGYEDLLNFWKGNGPAPSSEDAFDVLMDMTNNLKIENCVFQKDVVDALIRQVTSDETIPFNTQSIPGVVYATDYDMGVLGKAYFDNDVATYHVSNGQFTAWNTGWSYRNDGVDIEPCSDQINSNGYNIGWTGKGEWMQYDMDVELSGIYEVRIRIASAESEGKLKLEASDVAITQVVNIPNTGDWTNWNTVSLSNVLLEETDKKLKIFIEEGGFNLSSLEFIYSGPTTDVSTRIAEAKTLDQQSVSVGFNKNLKAPLPVNTSFELTVNGSVVSIADLYIDPLNDRKIIFQLDDSFNFDDIIRISHSGSSIEALDGTFLQGFTDFPVLNLLPSRFVIPGKIEVEEYESQFGTQIETSSDVGGGFNIAYLDQGDYLKYLVSIDEDGPYEIRYRMASQQPSGSCRLVLIDENGVEEIISEANFPSTGGWQEWSTEIEEADLEKGDYTLRLDILIGPFNLNWIEFESTKLPPPNPDLLGVQIYPNPMVDYITFKANFSTPHTAILTIYNVYGQRIYQNKYGIPDSIQTEIDTRYLASGFYTAVVELEDETTFTFPL